MFTINENNVARVVNLTPHEIVVVDNDSNVIVVYPSEGQARAVSKMEVVGAINGIELVKMSFGEVTGLPAPEVGTMFIVSRIVAEAAIASGRGAEDLLLTADTIRGQGNQVCACRKFSRL